MQAISEKIVEKLPAPETGNKVHFFGGAKLQGKQAPAGLGVRCTAGGSKSFVWFQEKPKKLAPVIDLMAALKRSLATERFTESSSGRKAKSRAAAASAKPTPAKRSRSPSH